MNREQLLSILDDCTTSAESNLHGAATASRAGSVRAAERELSRWRSTIPARNSLTFSGSNCCFRGKTAPPRKRIGRFLRLRFTTRESSSRSFSLENVLRYSLQSHHLTRAYPTIACPQRNSASPRFPPHPTSLFQCSEKEFEGALARVRFDRSCFPLSSRMGNAQVGKPRG